jgi:hypothetical protein
VTSIVELLDQVLEELRRLESPVIGLLEPASSVDLVELESLPDEVREFYSWRGGTKYSRDSLVSDAYFIPGYWYPSVQAASAYKSAFVDVDVPGNWFPLLLSDGGDCYAAVWDRLSGVRVAGVLIGEPTEIEHESIHQFLEDCLEVSCWNFLYR